MGVPADVSVHWLAQVGSERLWLSLGFPCFPLGGEVVSACTGASLDTRVCRTFIQRCAFCVEGWNPAHWATAGTDEVWFECWAEKKIDWMVDIDSSKSTSKGWLLSLCWHMGMDAGSCLLDNHCVLFQTHSRKCLFINESLSKGAAANLLGV